MTVSEQINLAAQRDQTITYSRLNVSAGAFWLLNAADRAPKALSACPTSGRDRCVVWPRFDGRRNELNGKRPESVLDLDS